MPRPTTTETIPATGASGGASDGAPATTAAAPDRPAWATTDELMRNYYDEEWGVPVHDERGLFEALSLEVFQSGLSWSTVLRKREAFRAAFTNFNPDAVAAFTDADVARLIADEGIIRNHRKVLATIQNARATVALRAEGGLAEFLWSFAPEPGSTATTDEPVSRTTESEALAKALKARGFNFVGPTTMHALMQAVGMVPVR